MYSLVRRFIKTGLGFLAAGLLLGAWMLVRRELWGAWPHPYLVSAHAHAVLVGFVMLLVPGVALWLFPRPEKEDARYRPGRVEAVYWVLTVATLARFLGEVERRPAPRLDRRGRRDRADGGARALLLDDVEPHPPRREPPAGGEGRAVLNGSAKC